MSFCDPKLRQLHTVVNGIELAFSFHTETSISLSARSPGSQFAKGWIDVHYPCSGHIKLQIRGALAEADLTGMTIKLIVESLMAQLSVSKEETFNAVFFSASKQMQMSQSTDADGMTDRIDTTRSFTLPKE